jgi:hypothetical protein
MAYMSLESYYKMNFSLQQYHKWDMPMVESWTPNDREIYVSLLAQHIEEENKNNSQV